MIRGLQGTSEIVKLLVPISVLLTIIGLANWVWKPDRPHSIQPFFGADHKVTLFGVVMLWHDVTILLVAVALALTLRVLLFRTRRRGLDAPRSSTIVRSSSSTPPGDHEKKKKKNDRERREGER